MIIRNVIENLIECIHVMKLVEIFLPQNNTFHFRIILITDNRFHSFSDVSHILQNIPNTNDNWIIRTTLGWKRWPRKC